MVLAREIGQWKADITLHAKHKQGGQAGRHGDEEAGGNPRMGPEAPKISPDGAEETSENKRAQRAAATAGSEPLAVTAAPHWRRVMYIDPSLVIFG